MRLVGLFIALTLVGALTGCDGGGPALTPVPERGVIVAFGDSLTAGVGAARENSYPAELERLSGRRVVNAGVSGETTAQGLARLAEVLYRHQPNLLILLEGGNDILRSHDLQQTKNNLASMIELASRQNVQTVLLGVPERSLFSDSAPLYRELAEQYGLVFDGELIADLLRSPSYKSDAIHFNDQGYRAMAESIYRRLVEAGAL